MEFRIKERTCAILGGLLLWTPLAFAQPDFHYQVVHVHSRVPNLMRKSRALGTLTIGADGVSYVETAAKRERSKHPHEFHWNYQDIQQLQMAPRSLTILTYRDSKWKLGADIADTFNLIAEETFAGAYQSLKDRLDQRFVAEIPDRVSTVLLELPVKRLIRFGGEDGVIRVGPDTIVYASAGKGESRTWRYMDVDNISSSGPFELTITTYERSRLDYGSRRQFNFQLKRRLEESQYNDLWLRLNESKDLKLLRSYRETELNGKP